MAGSWRPKLEVVMGVAKSTTAKADAKIGSPGGARASAIGKPTAQLRLPPGDLAQLMILAQVLQVKKGYEVVHWLLSLDHPKLDLARETILRAERLRKEN